MSFLNTNYSATIAARLTQKGRNAISKGNFNISYFSIYWISDDFLFSKMANKTIFVIRRFLKVNYLTISTISDYYSRLGFVKNENFFIYNNPNFIIDPIGSEIFL
jgi:hypothetical protein